MVGVGASAGEGLFVVPPAGGRVPRVQEQSERVRGEGLYLDVVRAGPLLGLDQQPGAAAGVPPGGGAVLRGRQDDEEEERVRRDFRPVLAGEGERPVGRGQRAGGGVFEPGQGVHRPAALQGRVGGGGGARRQQQQARQQRGNQTGHGAGAGSE